LLFQQVILIEEAWAELFMLCAIQWSMPMESSPLLSATEHAQNAPNGKAALTLADVRILQEVTTRFRAIQVDPAEFACLKAIVLFKPGEAFEKPAVTLSQLFCFFSFVWYTLVFFHI